MDIVAYSFDVEHYSIFCFRELSFSLPYILILLRLNFKKKLILGKRLMVFRKAVSQDR